MSEKRTQMAMDGHLVTELGLERAGRMPASGSQIRLAPAPASPLYGFKFIIPSTEDQNEIMKISRIVSTLVLFIAMSAYGESIYYEVAEKDTLWSIANKYNVSVEALIEANDIEDEKTLRVGMELLIPSVYVIEKGDNLWRIAREHQTSVQILRELNNMKNDEILVGDTLMVPALPTSYSSAETGENAVETDVG